jgi:O-antigen/teichoic acid export membrane protein
LQKGHLATLFFFGLQASVSGLLFYILDWVDRLIIKDLLDLSQVGIYSLAYRIAAVINILYIVPFSLVWAPARMQNAKSENADTFVTKVNSYYTVAGLFIVFTAVIFGREAMAFFFHNKEYSNAAGIFPLIMLAQLVYGYQNILDYGIYIHKKIYFYIIISAVSIIVNIGLNFLFIPLWGNIAAAVVTLFTYILNSSLIYIISNRYHRIHIEWGRVFWPLALVISSYGLLYFVDQLPDLNRYLIKSFLVLTTIVLFYKLWLDEKERFYLRHIGKRL